MITYLKQLSYRQLLFVSASLSLLFSFIELLPHSPINTDGMWYIYVAKTYTQSGWSAAMGLYPWPFLPAVVGMLSKLSGLNMLAVFYLINFSCQILIVLSFIKLVKALGGNNPCQRWAALVILIYPYLNSIRDTVTRDFGYWGFGLLAIAFLVEFLQSSRAKDALAWGICMLIASLFRIEGLILLALAPLALWLQPRWKFSEKIRRYLTANLFLGIGLIAGIFWYILHPHAAHTSRLTEIQQQFTQVIPHMMTHLNGDAAKIRLAILNEISGGNEMTILLGGLIGVLFLVILTTFKPLYFILALYGQYKKLIQNPEGKVNLLNWIIGVNLALIALFIVEHYFCAPRYPVLMILVWMAWVPFSLQYLQSHKFFPMIILILIMMAIGGLVRFGYSKTYLTEAGDWMLHNTPASAKVYTNSREIRFYGSHYYIDDNRTHLITQVDQYLARPWNPCQYDWVVLRLNHDESLDASSNLFMKTHTPVKVFSNKRHDQVLIYQGVCS